MALEIRPNCESCDRDLPYNSTDAMICSYECTFCSDCVETSLSNVCPNCGGGFVQRPIRPSVARRPNVSINDHPASKKRRHTKYSKDELVAFAESTRHIAPKDR